MAEKKRMAFNPLDERKPKGMDGLIRSTTQETQSAQDAHVASLEHDAQEKKAKSPRINLVIEPWAEDYLKTMAGAHGISVTKYINQLIEADRSAKSEQYQAIKDLIGKK